jgi:hypothetical protein
MKDFAVIGFGENCPGGIPIVGKGVGTINWIIVPLTARAWLFD